MRRECQEHFPRHRLQREPLVDDPDMHHGMCVTPMSWCVSGSLTRGEYVPGIPDALATRNSTYLARGPLLEDTLHLLSRLFIHKALHWSPSVHHSTCRVFVWKNVDPMLFWLQRAVLKFYLVVYSPLVCECKNNMAFKLKTLCLLFTITDREAEHLGRLCKWELTQKLGEISIYYFLQTFCMMTFPDIPTNVFIVFCPLWSLYVHD